MRLINSHVLLCFGRIRRLASVAGTNGRVDRGRLVDNVGFVLCIGRRLGAIVYHFRIASRVI